MLHYFCIKNRSGRLMQINPFNANFEQLADVAQSHKTSKSLVRQLVKFLISNC